MFGWGDRKARRRSLYSGTGAARLSRPLAPVVAVLSALLCTLPAAGCSYRLNSLLPKDGGDVEQTGSVPRPANGATNVAETAPSEVDLAYARAVAAEVLAHGGKDASIPWQNPHTGAGGNITPLATAYSEGGFTCREFLASYVHGQAQAWLTGEACRAGHGKWEVKSLQPFKNS